MPSQCDLLTALLPHKAAAQYFPLGHRLTTVLLVSVALYIILYLLTTLLVCGFFSCLSFAKNQPKPTNNQPCLVLRVSIYFVSAFFVFSKLPERSWLSQVSSLPFSPAAFRNSKLHCSACRDSHKLVKALCRLSKAFSLHALWTCCCLLCLFTLFYFIS